MVQNYGFKFFFIHTIHPIHETQLGLTVFVISDCISDPSNYIQFLFIKSFEFNKKIDFPSEKLEIQVGIVSLFNQTII